jgi:hypothetical protein
VITPVFPKGTFINCKYNIIGIISKKNLLIFELSKGAILYSLLIQPIFPIKFQLIKNLPLVIINDKSDKIQIIDYQKGYFLTMVLVITSPNLWISPYSEYQQTLFGMIQHKHEVEGMNFVQISDWLNENHFKTPRGKVFNQSLAWSMYTKKMRSIQRFSRENELKIKSTGIDVVNYKTQ